VLPRDEENYNFISKSISIENTRGPKYTGSTQERPPIRERKETPVQKFSKIRKVRTNFFWDNCTIDPCGMP
jgi:hypothetical protein